MIRKFVVGLLLAGGALALAVVLVAQPGAKSASETKAMAEESVAPPVTVARVAPYEFVETVLATGSLVAREEIWLGPRSKACASLRCWPTRACA